MISTGINELDQRLGGLTEGRYFLLTGTPGAGKTSASLHFIAEGLREGECCAILTQENPDDLFSQAQFIGYDFEEAVATDQLVLLQYRLDFSNNYARIGSPTAVANELLGLLENCRPKRLIVDSILPFVQAGGLTHGAVSALLKVIDELQPTCYFTVPGDLGDSFYARLYDPLISSAAGVFHFDMWRGDVRQLTIRKIRQPPNSTVPLRFVLRAGAGIIEYSDNAVAPVSAEAQRRVALVTSGGRVGGDLFSSLRMTYDLQAFDTLEGVASCNSQTHSAILIAIDALDADQAIDFVRKMRTAQNHIPIVLVSKAEGLRSATRARALRAGADEFLTDDASPQEFLSKVETIRSRGPRSSADRLRRESVLMQPRDDMDNPLPVSEQSLARAIAQQIATSAHAVFALARLTPAPGNTEVLWNALASQLRLADGDLISLSEGGDLVLYLPDVSRRHVQELLTRIVDADPRVTEPEAVINYYPADVGRIEAWLAASSAEDQLLRAHG
ncbi:MAG TPA: ATPase domain-containing protein [Longimicrobiales bacterium]|nr:ATPase domain-containing protein [Longimicrobiales bacterium]